MWIPVFLFLFSCSKAESAVDEKRNSIESSEAYKIVNKTDSDTSKNPSSGIEVFYLGICADEPPSLKYGKASKFERRNGSVVEYKCDAGYHMTGSSVVRCESGKWTGQPPTCVFFDESFVLDSVPCFTPAFSCYSDTICGTITYSRVPETRGGDDIANVPNNDTFLNKPRRFKARYNYSEKFGAFQCELEGYTKKNMRIVTLTEVYRNIADFYSKDPYKVANIGDTVEFEVFVRTTYDFPVKWKHNGMDLAAWNDTLRVKIKNVQPKDAGIYECFYEGRRHKNYHAFMRLIVRSCKENYYGENCDQKCPTCYNGGICHDLLGICICPAGFTGKNCEKHCYGNFFGPDCQNRCETYGCSIRRFCKPDPFGCACAPGNTGYLCLKQCGTGWYGADCKQRCHCAQGHSSCNRHTGACEGGCADGWTGLSCQIQIQSRSLEEL